MLTTEKLAEMRKWCREQQEDMEVYRPRKKCREVPKENIKGYVTYTYAIFLIDKLRRMLKRGEYSKARIIEALKEQDWKYYSFASKAHFEESVMREVMMITKKSVEWIDMFDIQAEYLEQASYIVIDLLEEE